MSPTLGGELLRAAGVGAVFLLIFAAAEAWKRFGHPEPEWTRKAVHLGGGLVALGLPWLVRSHWTVLGLGAAFALILLLSRRLGLLGSVHGVARKSEGGVYFPIAIYLVFLLGHQRPVFYLIAVLALVISDALAALIGTVYGRTAFAVEEDRRSVEGSVVFFLSTFLGVHLPLLLLTDLERAACVLIAVQIALLVTLIEAVCLHGSDNLFVPLATYLFLLKLTPRDAEFLAWQLVAQLLIVAALALLAWRSHFLTAAGTAGASLFFYGAWSLGGPEWTVAPALALTGFALLHRRLRRAPLGRPDPRYQVRAVFYSAVVAGVWFIVNNLFETLLRHPLLGRGDPFYPLFLGVLAAQLAMLVLVVAARAPRGGAPHEEQTPLRLLAALAVGWLLTLPAGLAVAPVAHAARGALVAAAVGALGLLLYALLSRWARWPHQGPWDVRLQALCAALASLALLPLQLAGSAG